MTRLSFGLALQYLQQGKKVARLGWNGKGMWLLLVSANEYYINKVGFLPKNEHDHDWRKRVPQTLPWIGMKTADNCFVPWLASQSDILAEDWLVVEDAT